MRCTSRPEPSLTSEPPSIPISAILRSDSWPTRKRAKIEVGAWIEGRYNRARRHASLGQISPVSFELQYSNQTANLHKAA